MIVMEMITKDYCELSAPYPHHNVLAAELRSLHQAGYVHGDIRGDKYYGKKGPQPWVQVGGF
jgi:hypothetical protein